MIHRARQMTVLHVSGADVSRRTSRHAEAETRSNTREDNVESVLGRT